jgi:hypothetical protein
VHIALGRIITNDPSHRYDLLALRKPALGSEPGFGLSRTRRHLEEGCNSDDEGDDPFD